ncbi:hypothetical protein [Geodermatophilus sp. SYSU D01176]
MSLLSRLAAKVDGLATEVASTDALALILTDSPAADAVSGLIRFIAPRLPASVRYTTQQADADGRPDIVGSHGRREVLHIEGKFWAGLTPAQERGAYLDRMRRQHTELAPEDPHVGVLAFVVPPRRVTTVMDELARLYSLTDPRASGPWLTARTTDGIPVAVISWDELLGRLTTVPDQSVAEDARQLLDLVQDIDHHSFIPWTTEQRTDQDVPRRILRLASVVEAVHKRLVASGKATVDGRRQTITRGGPLSFGKRMRLGGAVVTLRLSLDLWARYGQSPLWLSFGRSGVDAARRAFPGEVVETSDGWIAVPVALPVGRLEAGFVGALEAWLTDAGERLYVALGGMNPPDDGEPDDGGPEP